MRICTYIILTTFLFSCNAKDTDRKSNGNNKNVVKEKHFFNYDEINYYNNPIAEFKIIELIQNKSRSEIDSIKTGVVLGNIPRTINDSLFLSKLEKINFSHHSIDRSKFNEINKIFIEKEPKEIFALTCEAIYRDILVFRKKSKIVGMAKICFGCMDHQIVGTSANTGNFGQDGDYGKLKNLLYK